MALRALVVKLKALPLRVRGADAFALNPKGDLSSKIAAASDRAKYNSISEMFETVIPLMEQQAKLSHEHHERFMRFYRNTFLVIGVGGVGAIGYIVKV